MLMKHFVLHCSFIHLRLRLSTSQFSTRSLQKSIVSGFTSTKLPPTFNTVMMSTKRNKSTTDKTSNSSNDGVTFVSNDYLPQWMNQERTRVLFEPKDIQKSSDQSKKCVYYWMQRDMRTVDNWALFLAQHLAQMQNIPLCVLYILPCPFTNDNRDSSSTKSNSLPPKVCEMKMTERHGSFLLGGLQIIEKELAQKNVPFHVLQSNHCNVGQTVHDFVTAKGENKQGLVASVVVSDMNPLRQFRNWVEDQAAPLMEGSGIPFYQVDAHNIVPVWFASPKREVGARTLRPKINKLLPDFLTHFPDFEGNDHIKGASTLINHKTNWDECKSFLTLDDSVPSVAWAEPGREAAMKRFDEFCSSTTQGLKNFDSLRNDPNYDKVCSNLSPWVNYGMISFQRLALEVRALKKYPNGTASYIEEGIVRRELSDNYIYYSKDNYDELTAAAGWAQETLQVHSTDAREYLYTLKELENGETHDDLWNAAQIQLVTEGQMHGFLRMYWAKKILEWTESPSIALRTGLYFNDRFALDGNDPNGFVGVGWSIMGVHDMGWKERPIFGKIRFMNYAGCKRKFKVDSFVAKYKNAKVNAMKAEGKHGIEASKSSKKRKAPTK